MSKTIKLSTRLGCFNAKDIATLPPIEWPIIFTEDSFLNLINS